MMFGSAGDWHRRPVETPSLDKPQPEAWLNRVPPPNRLGRRWNRRALRIDNCPVDHNPAQLDYDLDADGDACDTDDDNDGLQIRLMFNALSTPLGLFQRPSPTMTAMVARTTVKTTTTTTMASATARNPPPPVLVVLSTGRRATPLTETRTAVMMQKKTLMTMETALMTKVRTDVGLQQHRLRRFNLDGPGWRWVSR